MRDLQDASRSGKGPRARDEEGLALTRAFEQGKTAAIDGLPMLAQPYRAPDMREAWFRGWRFMGAALAGLRPLDTVRIADDRRAS